MKIRSLGLRNFRKFNGDVRVDGIGDGLNVLVGPNEYGKSTLLAAINGVIFEKATSQSEKVKGFGTSRMVLRRRSISASISIACIGPCTSALPGNRGEQR